MVIKAGRPFNCAKIGTGHIVIFFAGRVAFIYQALKLDIDALRPLRLKTRIQRAMDASILSVHWHENSDPIYSVHYQPNREGNVSERLATGGGDNNVRVSIA